MSGYCMRLGVGFIYVSMRVSLDIYICILHQLYASKSALMMPTVSHSDNMCPENQNEQSSTEYETLSSNLHKEIKARKVSHSGTQP